MRNSQELETSVRLGLNLGVTVANDLAYGMIRWKQTTGSFTDWGLKFSNPDFVQYAKSFGAHGHRGQATKDLVSIFEHAFSEGCVHVIDVPVDYSENQKVLIDELSKKVCLL